MSTAAVEKLVRLWQALLGLDHWVIKFDSEHAAQDDCKASTWRSSDYDRAGVWLASDWRTWEPHVVEQVVVHELLHLQHRDVDRVIEDLDGQLHRDVDTVVRGRYEHAMEGFIERLAVRLVELRHGGRLDWTSQVIEKP